MSKLNDLDCKHAKPREKAYKLSDGGGLYLEVLPSGTCSWRLAYRFGGKQKRLVIGVYPTVSLAKARKARSEAKEALSDGLDPSVIRKRRKREEELKATNTFGAVATEFIEKQEREKRSAATITKQRWLLLELSKSLAHRPIDDIDASDLLDVLRPIEARGKLETARRLRGSLGQVFAYAIATSRASRNVATDLRGALASPRVVHRSILTDDDSIGGLWRAMGGFSGQPETRLALQFALLTVARPGEARSAEWDEVNCDERVWKVPAEKTKMRREWRVPLADQTVELLEELHRMTGRGKYLFPSIRSAQKPMSEGTLNAALRRMGYEKSEICAHGFRGTFSTYANESGLWPDDVIEAALAHQDKNAVRRAYNRAEYWESRVKLAQWWADELVRLANRGRQREHLKLVSA